MKVSVVGYIGTIIVIHKEVNFIVEILVKQTIEIYKIYRAYRYSIISLFLNQLQLRVWRDSY